MIGGFAYGSKPGSPSNIFQEGFMLNRTWPCPPLWCWILLYHFLPLPGWWGVLTGFHLELGGLILLPGTGLALG